jgi:predicted membrane protein
MKTKTIFLLVVALLLVLLIVLYHNSMSLTELILALISAGSTLKAIWEWFEKKEIASAFKNEVGINYHTFKNKNR